MGKVNYFIISINSKTLGFATLHKCSVFFIDFKKCRLIGERVSVHSVVCSETQNCRTKVN